MIILPEAEFELFVRTDFSNASAWEEICDQVNDNDYGIPPMVAFIDDIQFNELKPGNLPRFDVDQLKHTFIFIIDEESILNHEHPVLCIDLNKEYGRSFRVLPSEVAAIAANLNLANMDFAEFADHVDDDGIFRDFKI